METLKASQGLNIDQILNSKGFTLDFSDIPINEYDEEESYDPSTVLSDEMLEKLNLVEDDGKEENKSKDILLLGESFDDIKLKMQPVDGNEGVLKYIIRPGIGDVVDSDSQVTLRYVGYIEAQDEPFDSTYRHDKKHVVYGLGKGLMIPGLEIGVSSMKKFEQAVFLIQPHLAFGDLGCPPRIPPNTEVLFKVILVDYLDKDYAREYEELNDEEKKNFSIVEKIVDTTLNNAKNYFKKRNYKKAIKEYRKAMEFLEGTCLKNEDEVKQMDTILPKILLNLMVCYNKNDKPKLACAMYDRLNIKSGKAYYHYGKALTALGEHHRAMKFLHKALAMLPDCQDVKKTIYEIEARREENLNFEKRFSKAGLQIVELPNDEDDEFKLMATKMCDDFVKSSLTRETLPGGLSSEELRCFEKVASSRGLLFSKETLHHINKNETISYYIAKKK